jgi:hypothetical protein
MSAVENDDPYRVPERPTARETVARYLGAFAIFAGLAALVYYPARIGLAAIVFAMIAAGIGGKSATRFTGIAVIVAVSGFTLGMIIAVVLDRPIF